MHFHHMTNIPISRKLYPIKLPFQFLLYIKSPHDSVSRPILNITKIVSNKIAISISSLHQISPRFHVKTNSEHHADGSNVRNKSIVRINSSHYWFHHDENHLRQISKILTMDSIIMESIGDKKSMVSIMDSIMAGNLWRKYQWWP